MKAPSPYCRRSFIGSGVDESNLPIIAEGGCKAECSTCRNQRLNAHWKDGKLKCFGCGEYKPLDGFKTDSNKKHRAGKDIRCKACRKVSDVKRQKYRYQQEPLRRLLVERLAGAKDRSKRHSLEVDITLDDLFGLWESQQGKCALSGVPMTYAMFEGRVPTNISLDRANPKLGYVKGNVQLVCMAVNQMKSDLDISMLIQFCEKIVSHNAPK